MARPTTARRESRLPQADDTSDQGADPRAQRLSALSARRRAALEMLLRTQGASADAGRAGRELLARRIAELPPETSAALLGRRKAGASAPELRRRAQGVRVPLAFAQERLWVLDQLTPGNPAYNETNSLRLGFAVDLAALRTAVNEIVRRHEVLRTSFELIDDSPYQLVAESLEIDVPCFDLTHLPPGDRDREALRLAAEQSRTPFHLGSVPLLRATVFRMAADDHLFVLTMHHMVCDGWSMGVFVVELFGHYWSFVAGKPTPLPELPVQYGDYALWQRDRMSPEVLDEQFAYWRTKLAALPIMQLPADRPRPAEFTFRGARCPLEVGGETYDALSQLAERESATIFMVLLAAFVVLLRRYTDEADIVVGTGSAGRGRRELEPLIGFFVNTLVLRFEVADDATFLDVLDDARRTVIDAYAHQDVPFDRLVEDLQPPRDKSRNPLVQVLFQLFRAPSSAGLVKEALVPFEPVDSGISKTDLSLDLVWTGDAVSGHLEYNTDLFDRARIDRMVVHYQRLLNAIIAEPDRPVSSLELLTADERVLLEEWNRTSTPYPRDETIPQLFAQQADRTPDAVALRFAEETMTYRELRDLAAGVAADLRAQGVQRGDPVGLLMDRSLEWPAAALGILAAGGAYVPIDPAYPQERIEYLVADSGAKAVVIAADGPPAPAGFEGAKVGMGEVASHPRDARRTLASDAAATDLAYLMYTSGTTGRPKGVAVSHRNVLRLVTNVDYVELGPAQRMLQFAPVSFDASTFEVWGCLLNGGTLCVHPPGVPSLEELGAFVRRERITLLFLTTALFAQMIDHCPADLRGVEHVITGGEQMFPPLARAAWRALPRSRITNAYGPTECTTFACVYRIVRPESLGDEVPIGRPIDNTTAYVLDRRGNLMPIGVPGELCLGGDGVAAGYWNLPELTEERFVPDPFSGRGRLYRTGDIVCVREDGELLFLGRRDGQVKVSGYRIEPGEIEATLCAHPDVRTAVVIPVGTDTKRLDAFYEGCRPGVPGPDALREFVSARLPHHLVPAHFEQLEALPLSSNGKVDVELLARRASRRRGGRDGYVGPRTPLERELAGVWSELLGVERVGVLDNFFELGGHSLLATRLLSRVRTTFDAELTMRSFFDHPTVEDLARQLQ